MCTLQRAMILNWRSEYWTAFWPCHVTSVFWLSFLYCNRQRTANSVFWLSTLQVLGTSNSYSRIYLAAICSVILIGFNYAFTKECKLCSHMNHFNSQKCKQGHAQLAIGGNPTAKKGKKCKVCGNITVGHVNTPHCWLLLKKKITVKKYCGYPSVADLQFDKGFQEYCPLFDRSQWNAGCARSVSAG